MSEKILEDILKVYKPYSNLRIENFSFNGSFGVITKRVNNIYKEIHGYPCYYMGSLLKGVTFVYKGVIEGRELPPYQWSKHCINKVYKCTDSIRSGVVMLSTEGDGHPTDAPEEECYIFNITNDGLYKLLLNLFPNVEEKELTSYKVISLIKGENELWDKIKNIPNIDLSVELGKMGFSD